MHHFLTWFTMCGCSSPATKVLHVWCVIWSIGHQWDQIGLYLAINFLTKVAQNFTDFFGKIWKEHFYSKKLLRLLLGNIWKKLATFYPNIWSRWSWWCKLSTVAPILDENKMASDGHDKPHHKDEPAQVPICPGMANFILV